MKLAAILLVALLANATPMHDDAACRTTCRQWFTYWAKVCHDAYSAGSPELDACLASCADMRRRCLEKCEAEH